jgi:O-antigen/teichoic acid export membrane protein
MTDLRTVIVGYLQRALRNPLLQRVLRNSGYLFSSQTISAALSMAQGVLVARLLGVAGAGYVGIIVSFASNVNRLTSFRMSDLVVNYVGEYSTRDERDNAAAIFKAAVFAESISSALAFLVILGSARFAADIFAQDASLAGLFVLYGLSIPANFMVESSTGLLQSFNQFRTISIIGVGQSVLTLAVIAGVFIQGGDLEAVLIAYLVGKVVWALGTSVAAVRQASIHWGPNWWRASFSLLNGRWRGIFRFGVSTNLTGTLTLVGRDSDELWLAAFSNPTQVGYFKIAKAIVSILIIPVNPLISTTYREITREVAARSWENVRYLLRSGSLISSIWTLPAAAGLMLFGPLIISLYGTDFLPLSYICLLILIVGAVPVNVFYWNRTALLPMGLPDYPTKVMLVATVLKILGTIVLVPQWGAVGMSILLSVYFLLPTLVLVWKTVVEIREADRAPGLAVGE